MHACMHVCVCDLTNCGKIFIGIVHKFQAHVWKRLTVILHGALIMAYKYTYIHMHAFVCLNGKAHIEVDKYQGGICPDRPFI